MRSLRARSRNRGRPGRGRRHSVYDCCGHRRRDARPGGRRRLDRAARRRRARHRGPLPDEPRVARTLREGQGMTTLDNETITAIADELAAAERDRTTVPLLTARYPGMTVDDSYAVQNEWRRRGVAAGRRLVGRKIG